jgi:propanol-preferring alcohol dehydrogenase
MTVPSAELPMKQRAAIYSSPGSIEIDIVKTDIPEPGPDEVLINLYVLSVDWFENAIYPRLFYGSQPDHRTHSGVCHSDLNIMTNSVLLAHMKRSKFTIQLTSLLVGGASTDPTRTSWWP